jgi:hypothetical protein
MTLASGAFQMRQCAHLYGKRPRQACEGPTTLIDRFNLNDYRLLRPRIHTRGELGEAPLSFQLATKKSVFVALESSVLIPSNSRGDTIWLRLCTVHHVTLREKGSEKK